MRKSIFTALLVFVVGLSALSACGSDTNSDTSATLISQVSNPLSQVSALEMGIDKLKTSVIDLISEKETQDNNLDVMNLGLFTTQRF
jgi:peptidoglycan hydrolase CwlO-like protein